MTDAFRCAIAVALDCQPDDAAIVAALATLDHAGRVAALAVAAELIASLNDEPLPNEEK